MTINTILTILLIALTIVLIIAGTYMYLRDKTLNDIRGDVYQLFLKAEQNPEFAHAGKQKMKWVLSQARALLPVWLRACISDELLEDIVQLWFEAIKDLLDDGKMNKSPKKETEINTKEE